MLTFKYICCSSDLESECFKEILVSKAGSVLDLLATKHLQTSCVSSAYSLDGCQVSSGHLQFECPVGT